VRKNLVDHFTHQGIDVHVAACDRLASQSRKRQQVVDESAHSPAVFPDHGEKAMFLGIELLLIVFFQHQGEAVDGAQRRAQIGGTRSS